MEPRTVADAEEGIIELTGPAGELKKAIEMGDEQAEVRDRVVDTLNEMTDALQLAVDLVGQELSTAIMEFHQVKAGPETSVRAYFERLVHTVSEPALRRRLHEGHVCGQLHKLGDRFAQPFAAEARAALSIWDNVQTFFTRSNPMSRVLNDITEGERNYLRDFALFLDDVRDGAEEALGSPWGSPEELRAKGEELQRLMRAKRGQLVDQVRRLRMAADNAIAALH